MTNGESQRVRILLLSFLFFSKSYRICYSTNCYQKHIPLAFRKIFFREKTLKTPSKNAKKLINK